MNRKALSVADLLVVITLLIVFASMFGMGRTRGDSRRKRVEVVSADGVAVYPWGESRQVRVKGPLGYTRIRIEEESVRIASSPCPNQFCVRSGGLRNCGQFSGCLPNRVAVRVVCAEIGVEDVDAVGR